MAADALLGVDLGTSGVKALVTGVDLAPLGEADAAYPVDSPGPGRAEADPALWWDATVRAVRAALRRAGAPRVVAVGVDGQMHGLVLTGADGAPVRPALLWADQRAAAELGRWRALPEAERARLANPLTPGMAGPLLAWTARCEPEALARARWALAPKDWLRMRMTAVAATDPSDASATLLWDIPADTWSAPAVEAACIDPAVLPPLAASGGPVARLTADASAGLGLPPGIPVATGAGDTPAALLATGLSKGQAQLTVGSGAQIVALTGDASAVPGAHVYRTAEDTGWYRMAAVQNAGIALDWVRGLVGADWDELYAAAERGRPGADGVVFVPRLTGERSPVLAPEATGALSGLRLATDRGAVLRAALEGVAFSLRHAATALPGGLPPVVRLAGGGARSRAFRALLADVLGVELRPISMRSASAFGAALLAGRAAGTGPATPPVRFDPPVRPGPRAAVYDGLYFDYLARLE